MASGANQKSGVAVNRAQQWLLFDQMPQRMRVLYAAAPFDYAMPQRDLAGWKAGKIDVKGWRKHTIDMMCKDIMRCALRDYGPEHPDAERSRMERRA